MSFKNIFQEIHQDDDELNFEGVQEKNQTNTCKTKYYGGQNT